MSHYLRIASNGTHLIERTYDELWRACEGMALCIVTEQAHGRRGRVSGDVSAGDLDRCLSAEEPVDALASLIARVAISVEGDVVVYLGTMRYTLQTI